MAKRKEGEGDQPNADQVAPPVAPQPGVAPANSPVVNQMDQANAAPTELSDEDVVKQSEEVLRQQNESQPTPTQEELNAINRRELGGYKNRAAKSE